MKLTISTEYYAQEFMDWLSRNNYTRLLENSGIIGETYVACFKSYPFGEEASEPDLSSLFEDIIFSHNKITKFNLGLKNIIHEVVFAPSQVEIKSRINGFIENNDTINLEGFVRFRLNEYVHLVNLILYAAVKKALE